MSDNTMKLMALPRLGTPDGYAPVTDVERREIAEAGAPVVLRKRRWFPIIAEAYGFVPAPAAGNEIVGQFVGTLMPDTYVPVRGRMQFSSVYYAGWEFRAYEKLDDWWGPDRVAVELEFTPWFEMPMTIPVLVRGDDAACVVAAAERRGRLWFERSPRGLPMGLRLA